MCSQQADHARQSSIRRGFLIRWGGPPSVTDALGELLCSVLVLVGMSVIVMACLRLIVGPYGG